MILVQSFLIVKLASRGLLLRLMLGRITVPYYFMVARWSDRLLFLSGPIVLRRLFILVALIVMMGRLGIRWGRCHIRILLRVMLRLFVITWRKLLKSMVLIVHHLVLIAFGILSLRSSVHRSIPTQVMRIKLILIVKMFKNRPIRKGGPLTFPIHEEIISIILSEITERDNARRE